MKAVIFTTLLVLGSLASADAASPVFLRWPLSPTEKAICGDDTLAALDVALRRFQKALAALPEDSANQLDETRIGLTVTQKAWIAHRNACGAEKSCIAKVCQIRVGGLTAGPNTPDVSCNDTSAPRRRRCSSSSASRLRPRHTRRVTRSTPAS